MQEEAKKWMKQAEHDLQMACHIVEEGGYDTCAFLCQQAVEKYLKAFFIERNKKSPPRTHYLEELGKLLNAPHEILDQLKDLSADYTLARYPDAATLAPYEEYSKEDAEAKIKSAKAILSWIQSQLT